jgi:hypothetical protein
MTTYRTQDPDGQIAVHRSEAAMMRYLNQRRPGVLWVAILGGIVQDRMWYGANAPTCTCHKEAA